MVDISGLKNWYSLKQITIERFVMQLEPVWARHCRAKSLPLLLAWSLPRLLPCVLSWSCTQWKSFISGTAFTHVILQDWFDFSFFYLWLVHFLLSSEISHSNSLVSFVLSPCLRFHSPKIFHVAMKKILEIWTKFRCNFLSVVL